MTPDFINGLFETIGGFLCWLNVKKLYKEKALQGVHWQVQAFFTLWGIWNLFYYPSLNQWFSFVGGVFLAIGNGVWVLMAIYYSKRGKK